MSPWRFGFFTWALGACIGGSVAASDSSGIGRKIEDFSLNDFRGKLHSLNEYKDSRAVVVAFIGVECPLAKLYVSRLESLAAEYGDRGVTVLAIDSNRQDSLTELTGFATRHRLTIPVLKDPDNKVADSFGASRTPEVYLLDADRVVRYRGRIDDQYGQHLGEAGKRISYQLTEPRRRDLAIAVDELLSDKEISTPLTEAVGCLIGRVRKVAPHGEVTFSKHVSRILNRRCVECHRNGEIAPFALTDYDEVVGWSEMIAEVVREQRMPPWDANPKHGEFVNDCRLSGEEKKIIFDWVDNGSPEGDPADLPEPPTFVDGWTAGEPDQIVYMGEKPYDVAATGTVEYEHFTVDPGWKEDKWIRVAEARPGNRNVVHHILCFVLTDAGLADLDTSALIGWAPGMPATVFDSNTAIHVPAGAKILFQMHYTPNGTPQTDRSYVGFQFADPDEIEYLADGGQVTQRYLDIPAGDADHAVQAKYVFDRDRILLSMLPHMHLRGKSFRYTAHYPDGNSEILLDVPRYDFNWQLRYELKEPKLIRKGTVILADARYDNSEKNLINPDPSIDVHWGDQTWEEMMIGFFTTREVEKVDRDKLARQAEEGHRQNEIFIKRAEQYIAGTDKNGNGTLSIDEAPKQFMRFFVGLDVNGDGEIDAKEAAILIRQLSEGRDD